MLDILQVVIYPVGFIGLGYWIHLLRKAIEAQGQTIKIQSEGIKAQGDIVKTIQAAFETLDTPKMLERFNAHAEIIEKVKNMALEEQKMVLSKEKEKQIEFQTAMITGFFDIVGDFVSYVPREQRHEMIDSSSLPATFKKLLRKPTNDAPDYSLNAFFAKEGEPPTLHTKKENEAIATPVGSDPQGEFKPVI